MNRKTYLASTSRPQCPASAKCNHPESLRLSGLIPPWLELAFIISALAGHLVNRDGKKI